MAATSAERVLYATKSRKWNSTQNNKFPIEFPTEHAENLEWIRKTEEESARRRVEEEARTQEELQRKGEQRKEMEKAGEKKDGRSGRWIIFGVVGAIIAMRAWQRYKDNTL